MQNDSRESGISEEPVEDTGWESALADALQSEPDSPDTGTVEDAGEAPASEKPEAEVAAESKDALQPLESWSEEIKTHFKSLDAKSQQFLIDRQKEFEGDYTRKTQETAETRKRYEKLDEVLKPYDEVARRQGIDIAPIVASSLQLYLAAQRDPLSMVRNYIAANQLTPEQLGFGNGEEIDPNTRALQARLANTERELAAMKQGSIQASQSTLVSQIESFRNDKDESGTLRHPHFERVRHLMAPLVLSGKSMEDAYKEVVWTLPEHRDAEAKQAREIAEKEAKTKAEQERQAKVKNARKAETLPSSDVPKGKPKSEFKGWEKALSEELSQFQ